MRALLILLTLCGCGPSQADIEHAKAMSQSSMESNKHDEHNGPIGTIMYDGCEYVYVKGYMERSLAHKGNCANNHN